MLRLFSVALRLFYLDPFILKNTPFEIGLLDGITTEGTGFRDFAFSIELALLLIKTDHFSTLAGAIWLLHDHVIDIAGLDPKGETIALSFYLTLQSTSAGIVSTPQFIVGAVPSLGHFCWREFASR